MFRKVNVIVVSSLFEYKTLLEYIKIKPSIANIYIVPHGVSFAGNECKSSKASKETQTKVLKLLYAGYLHEYKGLHHVLLALSNIKDKIDFKFIIIGDGPYKKRLLQLIEKFKLNNNIILKDFVAHKKLPEYICNTHIVVYPSYGDMYGLFAYEALRLGFPVVVRKRGALVECSSRYKCCIGFSDINELIKIFLNIKEKYIDIISECPRESNKISTWEEISDLYLSIFNQKHENKY